MNTREIRDKILNSSRPLVFKNVMNWNILQWSLKDWNEVFKDEEMNFRSGTFEYTKEPQWERQTEVIKGKFDFFLNQTQSDANNWLYFDYKYLNNMLLNATNLRNDISWSMQGFPEVTANENVIWIGSKGAHTPCHVDTYGFNLVCQIFGRKLWVLFPPQENLRPTRVPYEESSIYSRLNFFSPTIKHFEGITNAHIITLEPGDVLYVPHRWWHYVENLETAISINVWLPSPEDDSERMKEALVQFFVKQISDLSKIEIQKEILNPNMEQALCQDSKYFLEIIKTTMSICRNKGIKKIRRESEKNESEKSQNETLMDPKCVLEVPKATHEEWVDFLQSQSSRFHTGNPKEHKKIEKHDEEIDRDIIRIVNAFTDPDVVELIQNKLLGNI